MKTGKFLIAAALAATSMPASAAPVAPPTPAPGRALILVPLTLTKVQDLDFGTVVPSAISGTVTINATTGVRSFAGGVIGASSGPGQRAYFGGAGSPNQTVFIAVTPPVQLISTANPADTITVLGLTLDGPPMRTINPVTRAFLFGVGGSIMINSNQPEGLYEGTFDVTAVYM